mgnify:CR=1 FL=1
MSSENTPNLNDLVLLYFNESGINTKKWKDISYKTTIALGATAEDDESSWECRYEIIPRLVKLIITNKGNGSVELVGVPGFDIKVSALDPDSLDKVKEKLLELYIWMKNINSECIKELLNES